MKRPLLTFVVATFNQEDYVREAITNAFAQTYSPLEIIISDDCSRDRTFIIASEMAAAYKGPHTIRLNRNPTNFGIGGHVNRIMELSRGALIIAAAGDDVSLPERTEVIYQAWENSGRRATSIFSSYTTISAEGQNLGVGGTRGDPADATLYRPQHGSLFDYLSKKWPVVVGCTHAWAPSLFEYFGPLKADLEDLTISFRTLAVGELLYVHQPLIKYRRHGNNVSFFADWDDTSSFEHREKRLRWVDEKHVMAYDTMLADIETLHRKGRITPAERTRLSAEAQRIRNIYAVERKMMDGGFFRRLRTLTETIGQGHLHCAVRSLPRALPRPIYRSLFMLRERCRAMLRTGRGPERLSA
jgi:glycosyltransferase involved in cell wall biosynthesis